MFQLEGNRVGEFEAEQIGKLNTTFQQPPDGGDPYGCGVLSDGRVVTSDIGATVTGPGNGQLIMWFPPLKRGLGRLQVRFCKLDTGVATAQGIFVDEQDRIYLASARGSTGGVLRYSGPFPTSDDANGGCGRRDATGAPLVDAVQREQFIGADQQFASASGITRTPSGGFYVSSVVGGRIAEFDAAGTFVRDVLAPKPGETLGTYSAGTPFGLAVDSRGNLFYADLDLVFRPDGIGPGPNGKVWRIQFVNGDPQPPEAMDRGLRFPDGLGVLASARDGGRDEVADEDGPRRAAFLRAADRQGVGADRGDPHDLGVRGIRQLASRPDRGVEGRRREARPVPSGDDEAGARGGGRRRGRHRRHREVPVRVSH